MNRLLLFLALTSIASTAGFQSHASLTAHRSPTTILFATPQSEVESFLAENYPSFYNLLLLPNEDAVKSVRKSSSGFTIFAPNEDAFRALGDKKLNQVSDPRNLETIQRMGAYHTIAEEKVPVETLLSGEVGGVVTMGGEVGVGPSKSGGFFGFGAQEDGSVVVGPGSRMVRSTPVGPGVVHEVDGLVSPNILWRYIDQLRIPGSS